MGERSRTGRPSRLYLGLRCRQFTGDDGVAKTGSFVRAIAEGLVSRVAAAAKADGGPASQAESAAFGIDDLEIPLDADRTVIVDGNFGSSHSGLRKNMSASGILPPNALSRLRRLQRELKDAARASCSLTSCSFPERTS